jgi:hypothetical protein
MEVFCKDMMWISPRINSRVSIKNIYINDLPLKIKSVSAPLLCSDKTCVIIAGAVGAVACHGPTSSDFLVV